MADIMQSGANDVTLKVGAQMGEGGEAEMLKRIDELRRRVGEVGTEEARALARQLKTASEALDAGRLDAADVEAIAAALDGVAEGAALSDVNIEQMTSLISDAAKRSRALSDEFRRVDAETEKSRRRMEGVEGAVADIAPEAKRVTDAIGGWAKRIPGVGSALSKFPGIAKGVGLAFTAVMATVQGVISLMRKADALNREIRDRNLRIADERLANDRANAMGDIDLADRRRQNAERATRAMMEVEAKIAAEDAKADLRRRQEDMMERGDWSPANQEHWERQYRRGEEDRQAEMQRRSLDMDMDSNEAERKIVERRAKVVDRQIREEEAVLKAVEEIRRNADEQRSEVRKRAEEAADASGLTGEARSASVAEAMKAYSIDFGKRIAGALGMNPNMSDEEAQALYEQKDDDARRRRQRLIDLRRERAGQDAESVRLKADADRIARQRVALEKEDAARQEERTREDNMLRREHEMRMNERKAEIMGAGNRLTAMGLGGGNVGADYGRSIANNTKDILGAIREWRRDGAAASRGHRVEDAGGPLVSTWAM
jgi:hypothetical protein